MQDITIALPFVRQAVAGAERAGYNVHNILQSCGIAPQLLEQPRARVSLDAFVRLSQQLMRLMDDEFIGLMPRAQPLGSFELIARSVLHERDLYSAMQRYVRSANLLSTDVVQVLQKRDEALIYTLRRTAGLQAGNQYVIESAVMTAHRFFCWLGRQRIPLQKVELDYPAPEWSEEYRFLFFGAPVLFDRAEIRLWMRLDDTRHALRQDLSSLNEYIARAPRDVFTPLRSPALSYRTREYILAELRAGRGLPRMEQAASAFELKSQTYWRRLSQEGTDYTRLRTQSRRDYAISLLADPEHSVASISEQLDFSEASAFVRAFKSWTGMTPNAYRD